MAANVTHRLGTNVLRAPDLATSIVLRGLRRTWRIITASSRRSGKQNSNAAKRKTAPINVACIAAERDRLDWEENN